MKKKFPSMKLPSSIAFSFLLVLIGCQRPTPERAYWSGELHRTDGKDIPFRAFVDLRSPTPSGYFLVGDEKTQIPEIRRQGDSLVFLFSEYNAAMRGTVHGDRWEGDYIRYRATPIAVPFAAVAERPDKKHTPELSKPAIPLVGKFQALLQDGQTIDSTTVATFWMKNDSVYGTLIAPDGDYGLNVGTQSGTTVTLSRFTGWQAQLFEFGQTGTSWKGTFYVRNDAAEQLTLVPRSTFVEKVASARETRIKNSRIPFSFSGITSEGDSLTNESSRFKGKALIVDIMGTWCHNCMDEAPILQQLYEEFRDKGLEVVGLSFEINDDANQAKKNLSLYQKRFGLTFPLLFCGSTDDKYVGPALRAQLVNFYAYPTALLIDKKGRVRFIHVGFRGPGTGEEFQAEVKHLYDVVKELTGS
jgi:thiol-disulfide isomerase/thioredoxin